MAGVWGTLSLGFFTVPALAEKLATGTGGLFYGGGLHQLGTQALGLVAVGAFTFSASFGVLWLFKVTVGIRTDERRRDRGPRRLRARHVGLPRVLHPGSGRLRHRQHGHLGPAHAQRLGAPPPQWPPRDRARAHSLGKDRSGEGAQARAPPRYTLARVTVTTAYPGRDGAHSAAACEQLFPDAVPTPLPSFAAVAEAAASGAVTFGVLPIESSLSGPVNETHDLLYGSSLSITAETVLPIHHCLVGIEVVPLDQVREVRSHPVALDQCRRLMAALPWASAVAAGTTADAAAAVANLGDPSVAAIASERAARLYGLAIIEDNVGDHPEAYTRFVSIAPYTRLDRDTGTWRTAFSFVTDHRPGRAPPRPRAVRPARRRSRSARLAADPALDVALPLRRRPRRAPSRRRDRRQPSPSCEG